MGEAKKAQIEKADKIMIWAFTRHKYRENWWNPIGFLQGNNYPLFLPPKIASAVRLYGDVTIFYASASFLSLPAAGRLKKRRPKKLSGRLKKRRPKKRIKVNFGLLFGTNSRKADEILSDFPNRIVIRFFCERFCPSTYACTPDGTKPLTPNVFTYPLEIKGSR